MQDRRVQKRHAVKFDVEIVILIPDQTFTPTAIKGQALDLSLSGLKAKTFDMSRREYLNLIRSIHFCKLTMHLPTLSEPLAVRSHVVWIDYHDRPRDDRPFVVLGFSFFDLNEEKKLVLMKYFEHLEASTRIQTVHIEPQHPERTQPPISAEDWERFLGD